MAIRVGIAGTGNIGMQHAQQLHEGQISGAVLAATSSTRPETAIAGIPHFNRFTDMLHSGQLDAVLIATPTRTHFDLAAESLKAGMHVLVEKPMAMSVAQAEQLIALAPPDLIFSVMLNQRFHPAYAKIKALLASGVLGDLNRFNWIMTTWYRPDIYYQVSSWRGTWWGEGGGLLLNQCIHNLDILQWLFGLPSSLFAQVGFGRFHNIEVEDDVVAVLHYDNDVTGALTASCGESPGVNRLEIIGDLGNLIYENNQIHLQVHQQSVSQFTYSTREMFALPEPSIEQISTNPDSGTNSGTDSKKKSDQHRAVLTDFIDAIQGGGQSILTAREGIGSLHLANSILMSAWTGARINLPLDSTAYEQALQKRIAQSGPRVPSAVKAHIDISKSYR